MADPTPNVLARRLVWFRSLRGLTQAQLAERAGVNRSTINDAESGQSQTQVRTLELLARVLGTTPAVLVGWVDIPAVLVEEDARRRRF